MLVYLADCLRRGRRLAAVGLLGTLLFEPALAQTISKAVDKASALPGETLTYTLTPNFPGSPLLTNATIRDSMPDGTSYSSGSDFPGADCEPSGGTVCSSGADNIEWNLGNNSAALDGNFVQPTSPTTYGDDAGEVDDTWIDETSGTQDDFNYGVDTELKVKINTGDDKNTLVRWDLSGISTTAVVTAVQLQLYQIDNGRADTVNLFPLTQSWVEGNGDNVACDGTSITGATYDEYDCNAGATNTWPGGAGAEGDTGAKVGEIAAVDAASGYRTATEQTTDSILDMVQGWINTPSSNNGVLLTGTNTNVEIKFQSFEGANPPLLIVTIAGQTTSNVLAVSQSLFTDNAGVNNVTVTMTLTSTTAGSVTPGSLTVNGSNGASATCGTASPTGPTAILADETPISFTYTCEVTAGTDPGSVTFESNPAAAGLTFNTATSASVLVTPPLVYSAIADSPATVDPILNIGEFVYSEGACSTTILTDTTDCFAIADDVEGQSGLTDHDALSTINPQTGTTTAVGQIFYPNGEDADHIEAVAWDADEVLLYALDRYDNRDQAPVAANTDQFGTLNLSTAIFTPSSDATCDGRVACATRSLEGNYDQDGTAREADENFTNLDIDGLDLDPFSGILYAIHRRESGFFNDVLLQIDPTTGLHVEDAFTDPNSGGLVDYLVLDTISLLSLHDIDDIAIDPACGAMYATANTSTVGAGLDDHLVMIDPVDGSITDIGVFFEDLNANGTYEAGTDIHVRDMEGLSFGGDGVLYGSAADEPTYPETMWTINTATGEATQIGSLTPAGTSYGDYESLACRGGTLSVPPTISVDSNEVVTELGALASIGDLVWVDTDGDGTQNETGTGLGGVVVSAYEDFDGDGLIEDLDIIGGLVDINDDGVIDSSDDGVAYGYTIIDGYIDVDDDGSTPPDTGDDGTGIFAGFDVTDGALLTVGTGTITTIATASDTTDANGFHEINNLDPDADWIVSYDPSVAPANTYLPSTSTQVAVDESLLTGGGAYLDADFGLQPTGTGSIGDQLWIDEDEDGVLDAGEDGTYLNGVTVNLYRDLNSNANIDPGEFVGSTATAADGSYSFSNLPDDGYIIQVGSTTLPADVDQVSDPDETAPCTTCDHTTTATVSGGSAEPDNDFGYNHTGSIGDQVFQDANGNDVYDAGTDTPLPFVDVYLYEGDGDSDFEPSLNIIGGLVDVNGDGTIDASDDGAFYGVGIVNGYLDIDSDGNAGGVPDGDDDGTFNGATVTDGQLLGIGTGTLAGEDGFPTQSTTTDGSGLYSFDNLPAGDYWVRIDDTDEDVTDSYITDADVLREQLTAGENETGVDFPFDPPPPPVLSKTVYNDTQGTGPGTTVQGDVGDALTYTIAPTTTETALLTNVVVTDSVPAGSTYVADSDAPEATVTPADDTTATLLSWSIGSNAAGTPGSTAGSVLCPASMNLTADEDTYLESGNADTNFGTNVEIKTKASDKRALIHFDFSGVPAGATFLSAVLTLTNSSNDLGETYKIHEMTTAWTAADATWNDSDGAGAGDWSTGTFSTADYDTVSNVVDAIAEDSNGAASFDISGMASNWFSGTNNGLVLVADAGEQKFRSTENGTAGSDPQLLLKYLEPSTVGCSDSNEVLDAAADTYLREDAAGNNFGIKADRLETNPGNNGAGGSERHVLLKFDLSDIAPGATINSATLQVISENARSNHEVEVREATVAWTEGTKNNATCATGATWNAPNCTDTGTGWNGSAGHFRSSPSPWGGTVYGTLTPVGGNATETATVTSLVQAWVNGTTTNNGFALIATGTDTGNAQWGVKEGGNGAQLVVDWDLPAGIGTTTTISATPSLVADGSTITVTMTLTAGGPISDIEPSALTVTDLNAVGTTAACGSPSPTIDSTTGTGDPVVFVWACTANDGTSFGNLKFDADALGDESSPDDFSFASATSNSVLVSPGLEFKVTVDGSVDPVVNRAHLNDDTLTFVMGPSNEVETPIPNAIGDSVYNDVNGDGDRDGGDAGIEGVTVQLYGDDGDGLFEPTTDIIDGDVDVNGDAVVNSGDDGQLYGYEVIDGKLDIDGDGTAGETNGEDTLAGAINGLDVIDGQVDFDSSGTVDAGDDGTTVGDDGIVVAIKSTDAAGNYLFGDLPEGDYQVAVDESTLPGANIWSQTGDPDGGNLANVHSVGLVNIIEGLVDIDGDGEIDGNDDGTSAGVTVIDGKLDLDGGGVGASDDGFWNGYPVEDGVIDVDGDGTFGETNGDDSTVDGVLTMDFGYQIVIQHSVSGQIWNDDDGNGLKTIDESGRLEGVTVTAFDDTDGDGVVDPGETVHGTVVTDANGNWAVGGIPDGADVKVIVVESSISDPAFAQTGDPDESGTCTICDAAWEITNITSPQSDIDFGYDRQPASVAGTVVKGITNGDGIANGSEIPLEGVEVRLIDLSDSSTVDTVFTDANGDYSFTDLGPGDYQVQFTDPIGYDSLADADGAATRDVIDGQIDLDEDGSITGADDGAFDGITVIDGRFDTDGDGGVDSDDDGSLLGYVIIDGYIDIDGDANTGGTPDADDDTTLADPDGGTSVITLTLQFGDALTDQDVEMTANNTSAVDDDNNTLVNFPVSGSVTFNDFDQQGHTQMFQGFDDPANPGTLVNSGTLPTVPGTDADGDPVADAGDLAINPDGSYTITPTDGFIGSITILYEACDDGIPQACDSAYLTVTVLPIPDPQDYAGTNSVSANDDDYFSYDTDGDGAGDPVSGNVLDNDDDPEGDTVVFQNFISQTTPDPLGSGASLAGTDLDGNPVSDAGTLTFGGSGDYTFNPAPGFFGEVQVDYEVCDDDGEESTASACSTTTLTIVVRADGEETDADTPTGGGTTSTSDVNDDPFAGDDLLIVGASSLHTDPANAGDAGANDGDLNGDTVTVNFVYDETGTPVAVTAAGTTVQTDLGEVTIYPDGTYTYQPNPDDCGPDQFNYAVHDLNGGTDLATVYLVVTGAWDFGDLPDAGKTLPPTANPSAFKTRGGNAARHFITRDLTIGSSIDAESNGQDMPDGLATGDDVDAAGNDEDALVTMDDLEPDETVVYRVAVPVVNNLARDAMATGWLDFNCDFDFNDANEQATGRVAWHIIDGKVDVDRNSTIDGSDSITLLGTTIINGLVDVNNDASITLADVGVWYGYSIGSNGTTGGWVDANGNATFDEASDDVAYANLADSTTDFANFVAGYLDDRDPRGEVVPANSGSGFVVLEWYAGGTPLITQPYADNNCTTDGGGDPVMHLRIRLTTDRGKGNGGQADSDFFSYTSPTPQGKAQDGEVEDFTLGLNPGTTPAVIAEFTAAVDAGGNNWLRWITASEVAVNSFRVERWIENHDNGAGHWSRVHQQAWLPFAQSPQGAHYQLLDNSLLEGVAATYRVIERTIHGKPITHGPFDVMATYSDAAAFSESAFNFEIRYDIDTILARHEVIEEQVTAKAAKGKSGRGGSVDTVKLGVSSTGVQFVSKADLADAFGVSENQAGNWLKQGKLKLERNGSKVAWHDTGDGMLFFGVAPDNTWSTEAMYRIKANATGLEMALDDLADGSVPVSYFVGHEHEEDDVFALLEANREPTADYWYMSSANSFRPVTLPVPTPFALAEEALLTVELQGFFDVLHEVSVLLGTEVIGTLQLDGFERWAESFAVPAAYMGAASLDVTFQTTSAEGLSVLLVDHLAIDYVRTHDAVDGELTFGQQAAEAVHIAGLSEVELLAVLDISDPLQPLWLDGGDFNHGAFEASFGAGDFIVANASAWKGVSITPEAEKPLIKKQTDYLVIAPNELADGAAALAAYRSGEFTAQVISLEAIFDHVSFGEPDPRAIRDFLVASANVPDYVVLLGDGSYDYRDLWGTGYNLLSPMLVDGGDFGLVIGDTLVGDLDGDGRADIPVGRIPAKSNLEVTDIYLPKLAAYEAGDEMPSLLIADNPDFAGDFSNSALWIAETSSDDITVLRLDVMDKAALRDELFMRMDDGLSLINYVGHGGLDRVAAEGLIVNDDVPGLGNTLTPALIGLSCNINYFMVPGYDSLGERLVLHTGNGMVASWAAGGQSINLEARNLGLAFQVVKDQHERLGDAMLAAFARTNGLESLYVLIGDPALTMQ